MAGAHAASANAIASAQNRSVHLTRPFVEAVDGGMK